MGEEVRLLIDFKERICDCIGLVCKMNNQDRIAAVEFWNNVSERLQTVLDKSVGLSLNLNTKLDQNINNRINRNINTINLDADDKRKLQNRFDGNSSMRVDRLNPLDPVTVIGLERTREKKQGSLDVVNRVIMEELEVMEGEEVLEVDEGELEVQEEDEEKFQLEEKTLNIIVMDNLENEENEQKSKIADGKEVADENFFIIEPDQPSNDSNEEDAEKDDGSNDDMILHNSDITLKINQSDSEDFHPDDGFDALDDDQSSALPPLALNQQGLDLDKSCVSDTFQAVSPVLQESADEEINKSMNKKYEVVAEGGVECYECKQCSKVFLTILALTAHNWWHTKPFKCLVCDKGFATKGSLGIHNRKHTGEKPFSCTTCDASFSTQGNLKRHNNSHTGIKPFECDICSSRFTEKKSLKIHQRIHTGEKPYSCNICNQSFSQSSTLKSHMKVHTKKRPHTCEICGRSFSQKSNLVQHKSRHYSQRNFNCDYCDNKFHNKADMLRHMKGHTGVKHLSCTVCYKSFTRKHNLTEHMNRHYDIKPWQCSLCQQTFFTRILTKQHLKEKNSEENHKAALGSALDDFVEKADILNQGKEVVHYEVDDEGLDEEMVGVVEGMEDVGMGNMVIHVEEHSGLVIP